MVKRIRDIGRGRRWMIGDPLESHRSFSYNSSGSDPLGWERRFRTRGNCERDNGQPRTSVAEPLVLEQKLEGRWTALWGSFRLPMRVDAKSRLMGVCSSCDQLPLGSGRVVTGGQWVLISSENSGAHYGSLSSLTAQLTQTHLTRRTACDCIRDRRRSSARDLCLRQHSER